MWLRHCCAYLLTHLPPALLRASAGMLSPCGPASPCQSLSIDTSTFFAWTASYQACVIRYLIGFRRRCDLGLHHACPTTTNASALSS